MRNAFFRGLYLDQFSGTQVYVSSGVSNWGPPIRVNPCEIALLTLRRGTQAGYETVR